MAGGEIKRVGQAVEDIGAFADCALAFAPIGASGGANLSTPGQWRRLQHTDRAFQFVGRGEHGPPHVLFAKRPAFAVGSVLSRQEGIENAQKRGRIELLHTGFFAHASHPRKNLVRSSLSARVFKVVVAEITLAGSSPLHLHFQAN